MKVVTALRLLKFWPPFFGAGIRVAEMDEGLTYLKVEMKLTRLNRNFVGTHFGGSLYSMVDPFYMLMLIQNLGPNYIVWDKAAKIRFKKPGRGVVTAEFRLSKEKVEEIKNGADQQSKVEPIFHVLVLSQAGEVVAEVEKLLYVKRKKPAETP